MNREELLEENRKLKTKVKCYEKIILDMEKQNYQELLNDLKTREKLEKKLRRRLLK